MISAFCCDLSAFLGASATTLALIAYISSAVATPINTTLIMYTALLVEVGRLAFYKNCAAAGGGEPRLLRLLSRIRLLLEADSALG